MEFLEKQNERLQAELASYRQKEEVKFTDATSTQQNVNIAIQNMKLRLQETISKRSSPQEVQSVIQAFNAKINEIDIKKKIELRDVFKNVVDKMLPTCTQKILSDCLERKSFFQLDIISSHTNDGQKQNELIRALNLSKEQKMQITELSASLRIEASKLKDSIESLIRVKKNIFQNVKNLEIGTKKLHSIATPEQTARMMLFQTSSCTDVPSVSSILQLKQEIEDVEDYEDNDCKTNLVPSFPTIVPPKTINEIRATRSQNKQVV